MIRRLCIAMVCVSCLLPALSKPVDNAPLKLVQVIPLPDVKSGDFDHFALDLAGKRLFLTGEENKSIEVFDLQSNKRIRSIRGVDTPHSLLFLPESNKLLVVDGGDGTLKCFDANSYKMTGQ